MKLMHLSDLPTGLKPYLPVGVWILEVVQKPSEDDFNPQVVLQLITNVGHIDIAIDVYEMERLHGDLVFACVDAVLAFVNSKQIHEEPI